MVDKRIFLVGFVGLVFVIFGAYMLNDTLNFLSRNQATTATIVDFYVNKDKMSFPIFEFKDGSGNTYTARGMSGTNPPSYKVGDQVRLLYDSNNPASSPRVDSIIDVWLLPILPLIVGSLILVFFVGFYIKNR